MRTNMPAQTYFATLTFAMYAAIGSSARISALRASSSRASSTVRAKGSAAMFSSSSFHCFSSSFCTLPRPQANCSLASSTFRSFFCFFVRKEGRRREKKKKREAVPHTPVTQQRCQETKHSSCGRFFARVQLVFQHPMEGPEPAASHPNVLRYFPRMRKAQSTTDGSDRPNAPTSLPALASCDFMNSLSMSSLRPFLSRYTVWAPWPELALSAPFISASFAGETSKGDRGDERARP